MDSAVVRTSSIYSGNSRVYFEAVEFDQTLEGDRAEREIGRCLDWSQACGRNSTVGGGI